MMYAVLKTRYIPLDYGNAVFVEWYQVMQVEAPTAQKAIEGAKKKRVIAPVVCPAGEEKMTWQ
jgi:hypothetical protein